VSIPVFIPANNRVIIPVTSPFIAPACDSNASINGTTDVLRGAGGIL
jgi:hypothetical protein